VNYSAGSAARQDGFINLAPENPPIRIQDENQVGEIPNYFEGTIGLQKKIH
jgi:hypothetical protein